MPRAGGFELGNEIFGGAVPRNFIPAIEINQTNPYDPQYYSAAA
jgi:hypothetical protein